MASPCQTTSSYPYAAIGFSDFWRRWHISLSTWLRDYLYIPLGGNQKGRLRTYANLMITMLLGGLWHGASWTFVVWGGLHGLYLAVERFLKETIPDREWFKALWFRMAMAMLTYFLINITWVFFRAQNFGDAKMFLASMFALAPRWRKGPLLERHHPGGGRHRRHGLRSLAHAFDDARSGR